MSYQPHNDAPTSSDCLDRGALLDHVAETLVRCQPPMAFGVHGDWGAGKTSFLLQLNDCLKAHTKRDTTEHWPVVTVWFEAWRYQNEPVPVVALLHAMRRQFSALAKLLVNGKKLTEVTFRSILASLDGAAKLISLEALPFSAEKIEAIGKNWEKEHLVEQLPADTLQKFLTEAIDTLLGSLKSTDRDLKPGVILLIDDLDRCAPEAAYRLLEGLKIYLNLPNCVFVLGMNQHAVIDAIAKQLKDGAPGGSAQMRAEAYLEKLCTHIWRLMLPNPLHTLRCWIEDETLSAGLAEACLDANGQDLRCLPPNPRCLKSLANLLRRLHARGAKVDHPAQIRRLLIFAYVYQFHSELFMRWHYEPGFWEELQHWVRGDWATSAEGKPLLPKYFEDYKLLIGAGDSLTLQSYMTAFPDPVSADIFWMGPLLKTMVEDVSPTLGSDFRPLFDIEMAPPPIITDRHAP